MEMYDVSETRNPDSYLVTFYFVEHLSIDLYYLKFD